MRIFPPTFQAALCSSTLCGLALGSALLGSASAQDSNRPDQVFLFDRNDRIRTISCVVQSSLLDNVIAKGDKKYNSGRISRIVFGSVPVSFQDAQSYLERNDYDNALRQFRIAADDAEAREPVRAKARLEAGVILLRAASSTPSPAAFEEAIGELDRFLKDFSTSRLVPQARSLGARVRLLSGKYQEAGKTGEDIFDQMDLSGKNAYTQELCLRAGLAGARAFLHAGDSAAAAALYKKILDRLTHLMAEAEGEARAELDAYVQEAVLGEGWRLLADGKPGQAVSFFGGKLRGDLPSSLHFNAQLGFAEGLLNQKKYREAQLEFATVSGLAPSSRDDIAQALVGLARCSQNLLDSDSAERTRAWLTSCISQYADTPAAQTARELLSAL